MACSGEAIELPALQSRESWLRAGQAYTVVAAAETFELAAHALGHVLPHGQLNIGRRGCWRVQVPMIVGSFTPAADIAAMTMAAPAATATGGQLHFVKLATFGDYVQRFVDAPAFGGGNDDGDGEPSAWDRFWNALTTGTKVVFALGALYVGARIYSEVRK